MRNRIKAALYGHTWVTLTIELLRQGIRGKYGYAGKMGIYEKPETQSHGRKLILVKLRMQSC